MKTVRIVVLVLAIANLAVLVLFSSTVLMMADPSFSAPVRTQRGEFTAGQRDAICGMLMLELAPGESLSTLFWQGYGESKGWLRITVRGIVSEEDFLSRLHAEKEVVKKGAYRLFGIEPGSDYECSLFYYEGEAEFFIGSPLDSPLPGLAAVNGFLYEGGPAMKLDLSPLRVLLSPLTLGCAALEFALIITLTALRRKAKKEAPECPST